jgi:hypothetical protein
VAPASRTAILSLLDGELRRAVAIRSDEAFLDALTTTTAVGSVSSTGLSGGTFPDDLSNALDQIVYGSDGRLYLIVSVATAKALATAWGTAGQSFAGMGVKGGTIAGITVLVSDAASDAILFDASQVAANSEAITLDASSEATVDMNDAPTGAASAATSLWQSNLLAVRATRYFGAVPLRSTAVVTITGTTA